MRAWPRRIRILLTMLLVCITAGAVTLLARTVAGGAREQRSQLEEEIDGGKMEQYLENRDEKKAILRWVENGALEGEWVEIEPILTERCVSCHNGFTMPNLVPLDRYESTARVATERPLLAEKIEWGTMERYLEDPGEQEQILRWIGVGAAESEWSEVEPILMDYCVSCHNPETGVPGLVPLDRYPSVARIAVIAPSERPRAAFAGPIAVLLFSAVGLYLTWGKRMN